MTAIASVLDAYGDIREVSAATWGARVLLVAIRYAHEQAAWRQLGDGPDLWRPLPWSGAKRGLTTVVQDNTLVAAWRNQGSARIALARYNLVTGVSFGPQEFLTGESPALGLYATTRIIMSYCTGGQHLYVTSPDLGASWLPGPPTGILVDAGNSTIHEVDVTSLPSGSAVRWVESDVPP